MPPTHSRSNDPRKSARAVPPVEPSITASAAATLVSGDVPEAGAPANAPADTAATSRAADARPVDTPADASTLDAALSGWTIDTGRAQAAWGMSILATVISATKSAREVQREAAERAESACLEAGRRLQSASDWTQAASAQADWLRSQSDESLRYWSRLAEIATRSSAETFQQSIEGWSKASTAAMEGMTRWAQVQAALPTTPEVMEAEAEHLTNPLSASPLGWPAQEAMRQGLGFATSLWNDWVDWSTRAATPAASRSGATVH